MRKKKEKHVGVATNYPPIKETLDMTHAKVTFDDLTIKYRKKNDNGALTQDTLSKVYPSRHAVAIIYGRLKGGSEAYLLSLINKIEREAAAEKIRSLT